MCIIIISPLGYAILLKTVHPLAQQLSPGGMKNRFPFCGSRAQGPGRHVIAADVCQLESG